MLELVDIKQSRNAVATALHSALSHLEQQGSYARLLFVYFSSAFNTILPHRLVPKLTGLRLSSSICYWILDYLTNRSQSVKVGSHLSASISISISIGFPQACVLSSLLYTLYTHDCSPAHSTTPQ